MMSRLSTTMCGEVSKSLKFRDILVEGSSLDFSIFSIHLEVPLFLQDNTHSPFDSKLVTNTPLLSV